MRTIPITYEDRTAALAAPDRFWLAARIESPPDGHPTKPVVALMTLFARDVLNGTRLAPTATSARPPHSSCP